MKIPDDGKGRRSSLLANMSKRRLVIDIGARRTKIIALNGELICVRSVVVGEELALKNLERLNSCWCSAGEEAFVVMGRFPRALVNVRPFANLDSVKKYFAAAVFFVAEMVRQYCPQEGLSRLFKPRIEVAVALPVWLMREPELATRFCVDVAKRLKSYRVTLVNSRAALCAYARRKITRSIKQRKGERK